MTFVDGGGNYIDMGGTFDSPEEAVAAVLREFDFVHYSSMDELLDNHMDESLDGGWSWAASRPR